MCIRDSHTLVEIGESKRRLFAGRFVGQSVSVLIERVDAEGTGYGWTGEYLEASITASGLQPRQIVEMKVDQVVGGVAVGRGISAAGLCDAQSAHARRGA